MRMQTCAARITLLFIRSTAKPPPLKSTQAHLRIFPCCMRTICVYFVCVFPLDYLARCAIMLLACAYVEILTLSLSLCLSVSLAGFIHMLVHSRRGDGGGGADVAICWSIKCLCTAHVAACTVAIVSACKRNVFLYAVLYTWCLKCCI